SATLSTNSYSWGMVTRGSRMPSVSSGSLNCSPTSRSSTTDIVSGRSSSFDLIGVKPVEGASFHYGRMFGTEPAAVHGRSKTTQNPLHRGFERNGDFSPTCRLRSYTMPAGTHPISYLSANESNLTDAACRIRNHGLSSSI